MKQLLGEWHGKGVASYPNIATTTYREHLTIMPHGEAPILKVEQITWRTHDDQSESLLYWECGFIRQINAHYCEWVNAQNNGRTEVLHGDIIFQDGNLKLDLTSKAFSNDARMIASTRVLEVNKDRLDYTMQMAIIASSDLQPHLVATLHRE